MHDTARLIVSSGARRVALNHEAALEEIRDLLGFSSEHQRDEIARRFNEATCA